MARKQGNLAASYSRASYTGTTIGNAAFDGRVRDGIGSDHSFMATKKSLNRSRVQGFNRQDTPRHLALNGSTFLPPKQSLSVRRLNQSTPCRAIFVTI